MIFCITRSDLSPSKSLENSFISEKLRPEGSRSLKFERFMISASKA